MVLFNMFHVSLKLLLSLVVVYTVALLHNLSHKREDINENFIKLVKQNTVQSMPSWMALLCMCMCACECVFFFHGSYQKAENNYFRHTRIGAWENSAFFTGMYRSQSHTKSKGDNYFFSILMRRAGLYYNA